MIYLPIFYILLNNKILIELSSNKIIFNFILKIQMSSFSIEPIGLLEGHGGAVTSLVCEENSDGSPLLFSGSRDKSIIQWELNFEGKVVMKMINTISLKKL